MNAVVRQFRAAADRYLEASHALFPQEASELGLHEFDALLGENDDATHRKFIALLEATLREIEALPDDAFAGDDWLDRRGLLALLRTNLFFTAKVERWRDNPQLHCDAAIQSIFHLVVRNSDRLAKVRPAIESRLAQIPRFLAQGAACLRAPVPLWTRLARQTCDGAATFFREVGAQLAPVSPDPEKTARLIRDAIASLDRFALAAENARPGPANGFSIGRESFEFLVRERLGFSASLPELEALGRAQIAQLEAELKAEARKFGRAKSAAQIIERASERWVAHASATEGRAPARPPARSCARANSAGQPDARGSALSGRAGAASLRCETRALPGPAASTLLETYTRGTAEMRAAFERAEFVTFPKNETCRVMPVPKFLRHQFPTAAYVQPGAFDREQDGIFWVNDLSAEQPTPAKRDAEIRQHFGLELTCAHEAYPGHHLQFVLQNRHPSKLRRLFHHAIFYEGWTLWCEKQAVERGVISFPEARLLQLHDALWRAHRIVIDCGLHSGRLSHAAACRELERGAGFTPARARGDVNWYTSSPTVPMSYLLGRLEVERLHAHFAAQGWTLRRFNDWILSFGALPWSWIWQSTLRPG